MIKIEYYNEDRILEIKFIGKITAEDIAEMSKPIHWVQKMIESGGYGIISDLSEGEEFSTQALDLFKRFIEQTKNLKQIINVLVFKDPDAPFLKTFRNLAVTDAKTQSLYFTDFNKAYTFLKSKIKEMLSASK